MEFKLTTAKEQTFVLNDSIKQTITWEIKNDHHVTIIDLSPKSDLKFDITLLKGNLQINYFILGLNTQTKKVKYHARNIMPKTTMNICVKVIQFDYSAVDFECIGEITKNAVNSKSHQRLDFLTFSSNTKSGNHPILIIDNNEVEAGHAGTVGCMDEKYLFYLMSRGISKLDAIKLVLKSQINVVVLDWSLAKLITSKIENKYLGGNSE
jgi:Fe-S cluster assembly scaffold protein SufB